MKKSKFRISSLITILIIELCIIDMIFMFCIVEVYASQISQTAEQVSIERKLVDEGDMEGVETEDTEIEESEAETNQVQPEIKQVEPKPEAPKISITPQTSETVTEQTTVTNQITEPHKKHEATKEFALYDIPLSEELQRYTFDKCAQRGLNYEMVLAIMYKESRFIENARSSTNDYGIMQINKMNHAWMAESLGITDFLDAKQSIDAGTFYLKGIIDNGHDDIHKILMSYNFGGNKAKALWHSGVNTSAYSRSVVEYMESLNWMRRNKQV